MEGTLLFLANSKVEVIVETTFFSREHGEEWGIPASGGAIVTVSFVIIGILSLCAAFQIWIIVVASNARKEILEGEETLPMQGKSLY